MSYIEKNIAIILIHLFILIVPLISLNAQDVEVDRVYSKTLIGAGISGVLTNSSYGEENVGIDLFVRHNFSSLVIPNSYCCINVNYNNYKDDYSITKEDYSASLGGLYISDPIKTHPTVSLSYCFGAEVGVLYKKELYYACMGISTGFVFKIYKNLNFEAILKTKYNPSDDFFTEGMIGLSYSL